MSKKNGNKKQDTQIIMESLEVQLTEPELKVASKTLAESLRAKAALEAEIDTFRSQKKAEITRLDGIVGLNAGLVNTEKEFRMIECEIRFDWDRNIKTITRMDSGEEIRTEPVTNADREQFFPGMETAVVAK